jgi:hypothetical protein
VGRDYCTFLLDRHLSINSRWPLEASAIFAEYYTFQAAGNRSSSFNLPTAGGLTMSSAKPKLPWRMPTLPMVLRPKRPARNEFFLISVLRMTQKWIGSK